MKKDGRVLQILAIAAFLCFYVTLRASADAITDWPLLWEDEEVVDTGVTHWERASGSLFVHAPYRAPWNGADQWYVVYVKGGDIWLRVRDSGIWTAPQQLSFDPANSRDARITFAGSWLIVVWEDDRSGHEEVWSRRWNGTAWSDEECLTCDEVPSRFHAIAGNSDAAVVWEEQTVSRRSIYGRKFNGAWGAVTAISQSSGEAVQPSIAVGTDYFGSGALYGIAWSDTRHANASIYVRNWGGSLDAETRATNIPGNSSRPVVQAGDCCGDSPEGVAVVLFENTAPGGVAEAWTVNFRYGNPESLRRVSPDDGIASEQPSMAGFHFWTYYQPHSMKWVTLKNYITWRESAPACHPLITLQFNGALRIRDPLAAACGANVALATSHGTPWEEVNFASIAYARVEGDGSESELKFVAGRTMNCWGPYLTPNDPFIVAPEGWPADTVTVSTYCADQTPAPGVPVTLTFTNVQVWDPTQQNPVPAQTTDSEGRAVFEVRGGGCVPWANVQVNVDGVLIRNYEGVTSPDINGDCRVTSADRNLVTLALGTSDFCADLDGSGLVTEEDVAIVQEAMGHRCYAITETEEPELSAQTVIRAIPNPSRGVVTLQMDLPQLGPVRVRFVDSSGRLVRDLGAQSMEAGANIVTWNGLDDGGHPVASGVYFALVRVGAETHRRTLLIVR